MPLRSCYMILQSASFLNIKRARVTGCANGAAIAAILGGSSKTLRCILNRPKFIFHNSDAFISAVHNHHVMGRYPPRPPPPNPTGFVLCTTLVMLLHIHFIWSCKNDRRVSTTVYRIIPYRNPGIHLPPPRSFFHLNFFNKDYVVRVDDELFIDATRKGNVARYINHSCAPNCYKRTVSDIRFYSYSSVSRFFRL